MPIKKLLKLPNLYRGKSNIKCSKKRLNAVSITKNVVYTVEVHQYLKRGSFISGLH
ncbi:MAG: hypothetical protein ACOVNR_11380 [Chitinophagaceae bacterium]